jgi:hypothetical protein
MGVVSAVPHSCTLPPARRGVLSEAGIASCDQAEAKTATPISRMRVVVRRGAIATLGSTATTRTEASHCAIRLRNWREKLAS